MLPGESCPPDRIWVASAQVLDFEHSGGPTPRPVLQLNSLQVASAIVLEVLKETQRDG